METTSDDRSTGRSVAVVLLTLLALLLVLVVPPEVATAEMHDVPESRGIERVCPAPEDAAEEDRPEPDDVAGTAHAASIECALEYGLVQGFGDGTYRPLQPVTRAQMATFVANWIETAREEPLAVPDEDQFPDIDGNLHADAINALAALDVVSGRADGDFDPSGDISRGQMARFLVGALDVADGGTVDGSLPPEDDTEYFEDVVGTTFEAEIQAIAGASIVQGVESGRYAPDADVTRGQLATFLMAAADYLDRQQRWEPTAVTVTYTVDLSGENELSVDEQTGEVTFGVGETDATGTATLTVDAFDGVIDFSLDFGDVTGPFDEAPGAHIHRGAIDQNGPIVVGLATGAELEADADGMLEGTVEEDTSAFRFADLVHNPDGFYVNVHSNDFPAGAVRGQLPDGGQELLPTVVTQDLTLTGEAEISAEDGTGGAGEVGATATATLTIDDLRGELSYRVEYGDVTGPFDEGPGLHVHRGGADENGPIVVPLATGAELEAEDDAVIEGTITEGDADVDFRELIDDPTAFYVNLHSNDFPAGAVRAQLE